MLNGFCFRIYLLLERIIAAVIITAINARVPHFSRLRWLLRSGMSGMKAIDRNCRTRDFTWIQAFTVSAFTMVVFGIVGADSSFAAELTQFPGLPDPGKATQLNVQAGTTDNGAGKAAAVLRGPDSSLQLCVTAKYTSGQSRDWTGGVSYKADPADVVRVDADGMVVPLRNGKSTITVTGANGLSGS